MAPSLLITSAEALMPTSRQKSQAAAPARQSPKPAGPRILKKHPTPFGHEETHIGATEDEMSVTLPPKADDDETKQG